MTQPRPTSAQGDAYRRAFKHFNKLLFDGTLPEVLLSFRRGETSAQEICVRPEYIVGKTPMEAAAALVHEMCHQWRLLNIRPPRRGYHDAGWAEKAIAVGLTPTSTGEPGGKTTGDRVFTLINERGPFVDACKRFPDLELLALQAAPDRGGTPAKAKVAYRCNCATVWGKAGLKLRCLTCGAELVEEA